MLNDPKQWTHQHTQAQLLGLQNHIIQSLELSSHTKRVFCWLLDQTDSLNQSVSLEMPDDNESILYEINRILKSLSCTYLVGFLRKIGVRASIQLSKRKIKQEGRILAIAVLVNGHAYGKKRIKKGEIKGIDFDLRAIAEYELPVRFIPFVPVSLGSKY